MDNLFKTATRGPKNTALASVKSGHTPKLAKQKPPSSKSVDAVAVVPADAEVDAELVGKPNTALGQKIKKAFTKHHCPVCKTPVHMPDCIEHRHMAFCLLHKSPVLHRFGGPGCIQCRNKIRRKAVAKSEDEQAQNKDKGKKGTGKKGTGKAAKSAKAAEAARIETD